MRRGDKLGPYTLVAPLARGGMGSVWVARRDDGGLVAVKTMLPELGASAAATQMFLEEAKIATAIVHEHVARVHGAGSDAGSLYLAMEWVEGFTLRELAETCERAGERLPLSVVLRVAAETCAGLHAAHELRGPDGSPRSIVHRDVSPHNVIVGLDGRAKLIDFGLAKVHDRDATSSGSLKGKIRYMPPEQAMGMKLDRRADVWAMAATIVRALSGRAPYDGRQDVAVLADLLSGRAPTLDLPAEVPLTVRRMLERALARDPAERHASADELRRDLERCLAQLGPKALTPAGFMGRFAMIAHARRADIRGALRGLGFHDESGVVIDIKPARRRARPGGAHALAALAAVLVSLVGIQTFARSSMRAASPAPARTAIARTGEALAVASGVAPKAVAPPPSAVVVAQPGVSAAAPSASPARRAAAPRVRRPAVTPSDFDVALKDRR